jgi:ribokinase
VPAPRPGVVVVGSLNLDTTVDVDHLPKPGETIMAVGLRGALGGKGANQAVATARQGVPTMFIAAVGDDPGGRAALDTIGSEGIDVGRCRQLVGMPTGQAFISVDRAGANTVIVAQGANAGLRPEHVVIDAAAVVLVQLEIPPATVTAALEAGRRCGAITVLNPAPARPLEPEWLELCDLLVPNETEAAALTGLEELEDAARALGRQLPATTIVVTCGADGALVCAPGAPPVRVPAPAVTAVDTVAAGDAFCGVLAAALAVGMSVDSAVRRAVAGGAHAVTIAGAMPSLPHAADVDRVMSAALP